MVLRVAPLEQEQPISRKGNFWRKVIAAQQKSGLTHAEYSSPNELRSQHDRLVSNQLVA